MREPVTYPPLVLEPPQPPMSKADREWLAFQRLLPTLLPTHRGLYVAIHNEQVVDSGDNELDLADRVWAKHGYVAIHVDLVTDEPQPPIRLPHFRVLSEEVGQ
jgi:hypothetical protein